MSTVTQLPSPAQDPAPGEPDPVLVAELAAWFASSGVVTLAEAWAPAWASVKAGWPPRVTP